MPAEDKQRAAHTEAAAAAEAVATKKCAVPRGAWRLSAWWTLPSVPARACSPT